MFVLEGTANCPGRGWGHRAEDVKSLVPGSLTHTDPQIPRLPRTAVPALEMHSLLLFPLVNRTPSFREDCLRGDLVMILSVGIAGC